MAKVLGKAIHRNEKTIFRIVADYERASQVPVVALKELEAGGIDPAARKNEPIIETILTMPRPAVESEPENSVMTVVEAVNKAKAAEKANATEKAKGAKMAKAAKTPCLVVPVIGDTVIAPLTTEEKLGRNIRFKIRAALANVPDDQKLHELRLALEEEMYESWGLREPVTIIPPPVSPCPSVAFIRSWSVPHDEHEDLLGGLDEVRGA